MAGKFLFKKFSEIDLNDPFFNSLKEDYPADANNIGFEKWFAKKSYSGSTALVFNDDEGLGAFVCLKEENEAINLAEGNLPAIPRIKISTLCLAERYRGQRLGEGAIGLALWKWQKTKTQEVYITVYEKHELLIAQLERFGFQLAGYKYNGECVYKKSRFEVDYSDPYKSFPFINPAFQKAGYLIVNDVYHDTLFPYSELSKTLQESVGLSVANGLTKIYVGAQRQLPHYQRGEPVLIYRRHTKQDGQKRYKSCLTSYCIVNDVIMAKTNNIFHASFEELIARIGNKSVFDEHELRNKYDSNRNLIIIEMLYCGYFGAGNNVNMDWLDRNGLWSKGNQYPANVKLNPEQFKMILREGNVDVSNVIINQP
jgi:GNAT superfamily N-acetyltransferase